MNDKKIIVNLDKYRDLYVELLKKFVKVESYLKDPDVYPTPEMKEVIDLFVEESKKLGFKTNSCNDGFWGYAEIGEGEELVGVLGHLDVVSPGKMEDWNSNPFKLRIADDGTTMYGRGVGDDKGPIVLAMIVLKALLDNNVKLNKRFRIIVGTDEEILWRGIEDYKKTEEIPVISITPDHKFPFTYAEKELWEYTIEGKGSEFFNIKAGKGLNSVPDSIIYEGDLALELKHNATMAGYEFVSESDNQIEFKGISVHAMASDKGVSAIIHFINSIPEDKLNDTLRFVKDNFTDNGMAVKIYGDIQDKETGILTVNIGKIVINKDATILYIDSRIPVKYTKDDIEGVIKSKAKEYGLTYKMYDFLPRVYSPLDSFLAKALIESYELVTGEKAVPFTSGGATYARAIPNCLAFGPKFPNEFSNEHQANEASDLNNYFKAAKIYYDLFSKLNEADKLK